MRTRVPEFREFLEKSPPGKREVVGRLAARPSSDSKWFLLTTDIQLECHSNVCGGGVRTFECESGTSFCAPGQIEQRFLTYICRNCKESRKTFALDVEVDKSELGYGTVMKYGEKPEFGPSIPTRVITLVGPDRELFLKGRRCENQGLGIGAFAYYRRVIEDQKNRLLGEIIKVSKKLGAPAEKISLLEIAQRETQFSKAIDSVKTAIPDELLIKGHNPLILLHGALSHGLHAMTDEQCLEFATSVREVLFELAEKIGQALKERAGLDAAVAKLVARPPT